MNPYWGKSFFSLFSVFFSRMIEGFSGGLASDEVQLFVLSLTAVSCGIISPFLLLKKMAMFANSLSHTALIGVVGAFLLGSKFWGADLSSLSTLFLGAVFSAILTAFLTEALVQIFRLQEDASIGLVFTALFALGLVFVSVFTRNVHLGVEAVMGNADALQIDDLKIGAFLSLINGALIFLFYHRLKVCSFDAAFAKTLAIRPKMYHFLLLLMASLTIIGSFRAVGVLLVLAYLVGPCLTARLFTRRLKALLFLTPAFGIGATFFGVGLSRHILSVYGTALSTGALCVCSIGGLYFLALFLRACRQFIIAYIRDYFLPKALHRRQNSNLGH